MASRLLNLSTRGGLRVQQALSATYQAAHCHQHNRLHGLERAFGSFVRINTRSSADAVKLPFALNSRCRLYASGITRSLGVPPCVHSSPATTTDCLLNVRYASIQAEASTKSEFSSDVVSQMYDDLEKGIRPSKAYNSLVQSGHIEADPQQMAVLGHLDSFHERMSSYTPKPARLASPVQAKPKKEAKSGGGLGGFMQSMFGSSIDMVGHGSSDKGLSGYWGGGAPDEKKIKAMKDEAERERLANRTVGPQGVYMYGGVGCGKTMLMDMVYSTTPIERKKRYHFHTFMLDMHARMHQLRSRVGRDGDPIPLITKDVMRESYLLFFDEFQVTDVADALLIRRLFTSLFDAGVVVVATSNREPNDLYQNGIQRETFLPFIDELNERCVVHDLDSQTDYRLLQSTMQKEQEKVNGKGDEDGAYASSSGTYFYPLNKHNRDSLENLFTTLTKGETQVGVTLRTQGREVVIPISAVHTNVCKFSFDELCGKALGAADYLSIANSYHTVFIANVPLLTMYDRNEIRRFITLIDNLYERRCKVIINADALPERLYVGDGANTAADGEDHGDLLGTKEYVQNSKDEQFAFDRTVSRLQEMQTRKYLLRAHRTPGSDFVRQFEPQKFDEDALEQLWFRYDVDNSGSLEEEELRQLLEDLCEMRTGHRNVSDEEVKLAQEAMDYSEDGVIDRDDFVKYCEELRQRAVRHEGGKDELSVDQSGNLKRSESGFVDVRFAGSK